MSDFVILPLEIWLQIAMSSRDTWFRLCQAVSLLGFHSLNSDVQCRMRSHFNVPHDLTFHSGCCSWTLEERWLRNNELHRDDDKPAFVLRYIKDDDRPIEMAWWQDGVLHRNGNKPAFQRWIYDRKQNTTTIREQYWQKGILIMEKLHSNVGYTIASKILQRYVNNVGRKTF